MTSPSRPSPPPRLGLFHCTFTGGAVLGVIFLLLWASEAIADPQASGAFLSLFTQQSLRSPHGMGQGLLTAVVVGALFGGLTAIFFNLFGMVFARVAPTKRPPSD